MAQNEVLDREDVMLGLVDGPRLLEILFPRTECRPSLRWLRDRTARGEIPYIRLGRLIFFNPPRVRAALET
jgi:hypothetical protein